VEIAVVFSCGLQEILVASQNWSQNYQLLLRYICSLSSRTTWARWQKKGKPFQLLMKQKMMGWQ